MIAVITTPPFVMFMIVEKTPNQYEKTFLAEFKDKYSRLNEINEKKIIFVGGSSLPFGLRSDLIEEKLGYKVVDYGLYATLGTKFMMDTSKSNINKGDVVVLSPEINKQTYSLYLNPKAILDACDGFSFSYTYLDPKDNMKLFYSYYKYSYEKLGYSINNNAPDPIGIYRHDSFNEYGDIFVDRPNNIMANGYDPTTKITTTDELLDSDFIKYVNDYCNYVRKKGAKIYFNFSPCNQLAIYSSKKVRDSFQEKLDDALECDLLSSLDDCIIDFRYFYDTNFHLNSSGAVYYTSLIINNLNKKLSLNNSDSGDIDIPNPPDQPVDEDVDPEDIEKDVDFDSYTGGPNIDYQDYFEYRKSGNSYQIVSIKDEYKTVENIILPSSYDGKKVAEISSSAFEGCVSLKNIYTVIAGISLNGRTLICSQE